MTDVDAIRAAIEAIAGEAYPAPRIRAALDARARHHRQRRLLLRTAGAVAATTAAGAGGLATWRLPRAEEAVFPQIPGGPGGGWLTAGLGWRPGWLPEGFGATILGTVVDGARVVSAERIWTRRQRPDELRTPFVSVTSGWSDAYAPHSAAARTDRVDVGGVTGELQEFADDGGVLLSWQPAAGARLSVSVGIGASGRDRDVATRVARSLRRDPGTFAVGPRPGWTPDPFAGGPWMYTLSAADLMWTQSVLINAGEAQLSVSAGPGLRPFFDTATAAPVDVAGGRAWLDEAGRALFAEALDGRNVQLTTTVDGVDLARVAREFGLGPVPDMTWYGTR